MKIVIDADLAALNQLGVEPTEIYSHDIFRYTYSFVGNDFTIEEEMNRVGQILQSAVRPATTVSRSVYHSIMPETIGFHRAEPGDRFLRLAQDGSNLHAWFRYCSSRHGWLMHRLTGPAFGPNWHLFDYCVLPFGEVNQDNWAEYLHLRTSHWIVIQELSRLEKLSLTEAVLENMRLMMTL